MKILYNIDLGKKTTIWVWSRASYFSEIKSHEDLIEVYNFSKDNNLWLLPLWMWSNVFFYNDIKDKVVIQLKNRSIDKLTWDLFEIWAWSSLQGLILLLAKQWYDLSSLSWYPSTVWWAIAVNSGLMGKDIGNFLLSANVFNFNQWKFEKWSNEDFDFSYRHSKLKWKGWYIIFDCIISVPRDMNVLENLEKILKARVWSQPIWKCSWCFFKNPEWDYAWRLIEEAWLKWFSIGWAFVSDVHANFLMTNPDVKKEELFDLIDHIKKEVLKKFGISLAQEVLVY